MMNLSCRRSRKLRAMSASSSTIFTLLADSIMNSLHACFNISLRRNSTIYHNSALSERVIEEDERLKLSTSTSIDDLSEYVLMEVFHRLPVNSIFRLKSVSKRWNSIISDPHFTHGYASRRRSCSPPFALFYIGFIPGLEHPCRLGPYCPPFRHEQTLSTFPLNFFTTQLQELQKEISDLQLIGCSGDLLLFSGTAQLSTKVFCVCNPLTFSWTTLQQPHSHRHEQRNAVVGFLVEDDGTFWIVQILAPFFQPSRLLVYCSAMGKWSFKKVVCPGLFHSFTMIPTQVYQGSIVWMGDDGLLWYDPRMAVMMVFDLPDDRRVQGRLGVSCGRLHYYELNRHEPYPSMRVWMMSEREAGKWVMNHEITYDHFWSTDESLKPFLALPNTQRYLRWVSYNPTHSNVVFLKCDRQLVTCNLSSAFLEVLPCSYESEEGIFYRLEFDVIPLVFKPWPTAVFITSKKIIDGPSSTS